MFAAGVLALGSMTTGIAAQEAPLPGREAAVQAAREGRFEQAVNTLQAQLAQQPSDTLARRDLMVVLSWAGRFDQSVAVARPLAVEELPDYALLALAQARRGVEDTEAARQLARRIDANGPHGADAAALTALLDADRGEIDEANRRIEEALLRYPDSVEVSAAAAWIFGLQGRAADALAAAGDVLAVQPEHSEALRQRVFALRDLDAATRAFELAAQHPDVFSPAELQHLELDRIAQSVRWVYLIDDQRRQIDASERAHQKLMAFKSRPDLAPSVRERVRFDEILVNRQRRAFELANEQYQALVDDRIEPPRYVTIAAADAWLAQREPEQALALYRQVLADAPPMLETRISMFYALVESEHYREAEQLIDELSASLPTHYSVRQSDQRIENWDRLRVDLLGAMLRAWANRHDKAAGRLEALLADAPASAWIRRELALVYRWRGLPHQALEQIEMALAYEPDVLDARLTHAGILSDLGRYRDAGQRIEALRAQYPDNTHVEREYQYWHDRDRWSVDARGEYGDTEGGVQEFGSRDRSFGVRFSSPWIGEHVQAHVFNYYSDARFPEGDADYDRIGIGLSWRHLRRHAYAELSRRRPDDRATGVTAGYDWHSGDHWSFATRYESFSTDVPLRARGQGIDGWKGEAAVRWQAHESLSVRLSGQHVDFSDGNERFAALLSIPHRLRSRAHHITAGTLDLYTSSNSRDDAPYFNPDRDFSAGYSVTHDWVTWRRYNRRFTQRFIAGAGLYWQQDFGTEPTAWGRYEHDWHLSRTWRLRYGVGIASQVFDGDHERRLDARIQIQGVF